MERFLCAEEMLKHIKGRHNTGEIKEIMPFIATRRTQMIRGNIHSVMGELVRIICGYNILLKNNKEDDFISTEHPLIEQIINSIEAEDDHKFDLALFLENYLFNDEDDIKPTHPYLYNYVTLMSKHKTEIEKHAQFAYDTLNLNKSTDIKMIFNTKEADDILTELILEKLEGLKTRGVKNRYQPLLPKLSELYQEDLIFLSKYKDYFLQSFSLLTQFYMFMYCCQLLLKFEQFHEANYNEMIPIFFALEWEAINGRRGAAGIRGFRKIKDSSANLFVHIHTMSQLSNNGKNREKRFMNYIDLLETVKNDKQKQTLFFHDVKEWIIQYRNLKQIDDKDEPQSLEESFRILFKALQKGMSTESCKRYGENFIDLGAPHFLKNRGNLGQVLNMSHEMLLLLTAICVKNDRIPLNQLFVEFEKRGVIFDRFSKNEILNLFDTLNIIDKKSDSGDAQYVKPIL